MNPVIYGLLILTLLAAAPRVHAQTATGAVETVYVRIERGVFIEKSLIRRQVATNTPNTWSEVRLLGAVGGRSELAQNPAAMDIRKGDIVQVSISPPPDFATGPAPEVNRIVARIAPAGSPQAQRIAGGTEMLSAPASYPLTIAEALR
jgi:hypothetical protein